MSRFSHAEEQSYSTTMTGMTGLNLVPSARMDAAGTTRLGAGNADPYNQAFLGMQIAKPLYINLRQSMLVSSAGDKPERVYPGMDIKLRIAEEGRYRPEMAFGMDSALGHKRFSSEYFALSKRYYDLDFTGGIAWGRLGSAGHIKNPLARISSHFAEDRDYNSEDSSSPSDWFTGDQIGFFGGVEYFTPLKGLSLKADFNADAYKGETTSTDFKKPSPWSVGFNYSPREWVSFGASVTGLDKVMARLTFQTNPLGWKGYKNKEKDTPSYDKEKELKNPAYGKTRIDGHDFSGVLYLNDYEPSARQIGRAARHLSTTAGPGAETISVIPVKNGLRARAVTFSRRALDQAAKHNQGSPEEIWQAVSFSEDSRSISRKPQPLTFKLVPELALSPGEEETTHLYRTGVVFEERKDWGHGFISGNSFRLNIADNLHRLFKFRDVNLDSVRADADLFTMNRVNVDRSFLTFARTPLPDLHFAATAGYLEEMYAGIGGEVLYRPFQSPFALGGEVWKVYKRDALTPLAMGLTDFSAVTGTANLYYQVPDTDITAFAKAGRFIGGDFGVHTGAQMQMDSGVRIKGFVSVSNSDDKDVFGADRNVYAGIQLAIPFGDLPLVPRGSEARVRVEPIGRDDAALIDKPYDLYEVTEPTSYRHLGRNWQEVLN